MKRLKKTLAVILTLCMMMSCVSVTAFATGTDASEKDQTATEETNVSEDANTPENVNASEDANTSEDANKEAVVSSDSEEENDKVTLEDQWLKPQSSGVSTDDFFKIAFLDCGRKYFSVDSIKKIIDNAATAGFNYVQLAVGNDGLRFLLNDMSLTVNGTTYENKAVSDAIHAGNENYYNFPTDELTESEMSTIISYAKSKGLGVIPCINSPGHMDAILSAANSLTEKTCSYNDSVRTIDVTNNTAVAFTQALIQKYITYFAGKGCQYFNIGADEYANDKYTGGSMGFGNLQATGNYKYYVQYVNQMAFAVKDSGMKPMAFNDGIYFNNNTSSGTFDTDIIVCYWSSGWSSYKPMPATTLASKGFKLINTNGDYYWVLGNSDAQCNATKASGFNYKEFPGGTINNPAGAMFCIWCDYPGADTEANVIKSTSATIAAFGTTLPTDPTKKTIRVRVGDTATDTIEGTNCSGTYPTEEPSIATVKTEYTDGTEAKINKVSQIESGKQYLILNQRYKALLTNQSSTWTSGRNNYKCLKLDGTASTTSTDLWTITENSGNYTVADASGKYLTIGNNIASVNASSSNITLSYKSYNEKDNYWNISSNSYYLNNMGGSKNAGGWKNNDAPTDGGSKWDIYEVTKAQPAGTKVTFSGVAVGTTHVTIGGITYTINVVDEAPSGSLTDESIDLEYWITNSLVYDTEDKEHQKRTISRSEAETESGVAISDFAPSNAYSFFDGTKTVYYWQAMRLDADHQQTADNGVDQTTKGTTITHIRYYNEAWQYKTSDGVWHYFKSGDQLVAYYLQKTKVTQEIDTYVKDWGYGTSTTTPGTSGNDGQVALTVAVVYPDGTVSPAEGKMYANSTTIFNYWDDRDIGIIAPMNNSDYDISKITVTDGTRDSNSSANVWYTNDTITWDKVTTESGSKWYDETTVWDETTNAGSAPMVNGKASNIRWSAKNTAKLVLIYLKPVEKSTNLKVVYHDDAYNKEIMHNQIAMKYTQGDAEPTFFNSLINSKRIEKDGDITLDDNAYVTNSSGVDQHFNKDITIIPNVAAQYKSGLYEYIKADISEKGKTLTLHYNINKNKLDKSYVIDYGLKLQIPISDLVKEGSVSEKTKVEFGDISNGKATYENGTITYTPDKVLTGVVTIPVKISYTGENYQTIQVAVYPATTVNYEEGFATYTDNWTGASKGEGTQTTAVLGQDENNYGYDGAYANTKVESNGTQATSNTKLDTATFDFTGTGVDILANTTESSGYLTIRITNKDSKQVEKIAIVNTKMAGNSTAGATNGYSVPVYSDTDLAYGNYTVSITHSMNAATVNIDGFRVYNTNKDSSIYKDDNEDNPNFLEVRDLQFGDITDIGSYGVDGKKVYAIGEQVYKDLTKDATKVEAAITVNGQDNKANQTELLENGPKNEVYLAKGSAITMTFSTQREVQLGLKGVDGQASYTIRDGQKSSSGTASTLDMFYTIKGKTDSPDKKTITITNTGDNVLSITKLKVCDDPNALQTISADSMTSALYAWGFTDPVPTADATANLNLVDYTGKTIASTSLTANGEQGTDATFTADQIKSAVTSALPEGYAVVDASKIADQTVKYGESADVNVQIGKVATLKVTYKKLFGKTVGTVTLTGVQTSAGSKYSFSASEIKKAVPSGYWTIKLWGTKVKYGTTGTLTVNVF